MVRPRSLVYHTFSDTALLIHELQDPSTLRNHLKRVSDFALGTFSIPFAYRFGTSDCLVHFFRHQSKEEVPELPTGANVHAHPR